jgi:hypothetical protein
MTRFGKILVELGYLTPRDLWDGVKTQVEDIVRSLFSYTAGWIHFWEGEIEPHNTVRLSLPTHRLISEGLARRDELLRFIAQLEDPRTRLHAAGEPRKSGSENERALLAALRDANWQPCHRTGLIRAPPPDAAVLQLTGRCRSVRKRGREEFATATTTSREAVSPTAS